MNGFRALMVIGLMAGAGCSARGAGGPPNVLLIISDDQGYADMSCIGTVDDVNTPAMDAIARRGVRFTSAYVTAPICNASRISLMTGSYHQRQGGLWYGGRGMHDPKYVTIAELLKQRGYATGYVGKFHYGGRDEDAPGHRNFPLNHGFDTFYGFAGGRKHYMVHEEAAEEAFQRVKAEYERTGQSLQQGPIWQDLEQRDEEGFSTELFGERARRFMRDHRDGPFFLVLSFNAVHNFTHQLPESYLKAHGLTGWRDWNPAVEEYYDWYQQGRYPNNPEGREHYLGQLHFLDREIGRVMNELRRLGLEKDTLVIYIADNGGSTPIYANNAPLRGSKFTLYEGGLRVPLIIAWSGGGLESGSVRDNTVSAMDLLPTICRAAGVPVPDHVDGMDLTPLLTGEDTGIAHETLHWHTPHESAVRHGRWKLRTAHRDRHARYEMVELELGEFLYDLETDLGETTNAAEAHPEVFARLMRMHEAWWDAMRASED